MQEENKRWEWFLSDLYTEEYTYHLCDHRTGSKDRGQERNGTENGQPQKAWKTSGQWFDGICQKIADAGIVDDTNHDAAPLRYNNDKQKTLFSRVLSSTLFIQFFSSFERQQKNRRIKEAVELKTK